MVRFRIALQYMECRFEFNVNKTKLTRIMNLLNLDVVLKLIKSSQLSYKG